MGGNTFTLIEGITPFLIIVLPFDCNEGITPRTLPGSFPRGNTFKTIEIAFDIKNEME
jgi:hypothetical protein